MGTVKSVSLSESEAKFLQENELSPSGLIKQAIRDAQERLNSVNPTVSTAKKLEISQRKLTLAYDFINFKGCFDEFLVWKERKTEE